MSVYIVTGKLGSGKTLVSVSRMIDALKAGRRVATNIDVDLSQCIELDQKTQLLTRLPDKPSAENLDLLGEGQTGDYDESKFGLLVLDELGAWLNSRTWSDKTRMAFINWCIHARHLRWAVIFIVQDAKMIDAQVRDALGEHLVVCKRTDRIPIPLLGKVTPKVHVGNVYYGMTASKEKRIERWVYRGKHLYSAYRTDQIFSSEYDKGVYSVISKNYWEPDKTKDLKAKLDQSNRIKLAGTAVLATGLLGSSVYAMVKPDTPEETNATQQPKATETTRTTSKFAQIMKGARYQGTFSTSGKDLHLFGSYERGSFNSGFIESIGGMVQVVSHCMAMVIWPDKTVTVVSCNEAITPKDKEPSGFLGL